MASNDDNENELIRTIKRDETIIKKNRVLTIYIVALGLAFIMIVGLSILIVLGMKQMKADRLDMRIAQQRFYDVTKDIEKINRRTQAMNDISRIALYYNKDFDEWTLNQISQMIYDIGEQRYGIPYEEFAVLISLESRWHIKAVSHMYAKGLCQIQWETAKWACGDLETSFEGDDTLYNPIKNVRLGLYIYKTFKEKFEYQYPWYIVAYAGGETKIYPLFLKRAKICGEYLQYHRDWLKVKAEVEKILGRTLDIQQ
jgi:soluble lytic murein transglycosylase-like protein